MPDDISLSWPITNDAELYEALYDLQRQALQSTLNDPANEWGWEALQKTRAALAKARGEPRTADTREGEG